MSDPSPNSAPPPRALAQGTGVVLQTVGVLMFLTTCCVCSSSFLWDPIRAPGEAMDQAPRDLQALTSPTPWRKLSELGSDPAKTGMMLTVMSMTLGGLALASFGLGLQADRRRAAGGALVSELVMLAVLAVAGVGLWSGEGGWSVRLWHAILLVTTLGLTVLTVAAWRQVRATPPPADVDVIPPDTKIPYSLYHDDPPEVRLADEIARRRQELEAEQKRLAEMEQQLRALRDKPNSSP